MQAPVLARHHRDRTCSGINVPRLILMTDDDRLADPASIIPSLPAGSAVIVRSRSDSRREQCAHAISNLCRHHQITLLISYNAPPAKLIGDGVHVPQEGRKNWRQTDFCRLQPCLVTTSAHDLAAAQRGTAWGADAILLSPIFATQSHPGAKSLGVWRGAAISRHLNIPTIALGGMDDVTISRALNLKFFGCAGIGLFQA